ncbi:MAG: hypothetical protein PHF51_03170 [Candidatus ainarchaeum sp.]|nr:hypothetical protein [Candidatus ainarchaeum sp.]
MNVTVLDASSVGLMIIVIGWSTQIYHTWKNGNTMHPLFLLFYSLGTLVVAAGGMTRGFAALDPVTILNLVAFLLAILVLASIAPLDERESERKPKRKK